MIRAPMKQRLPPMFDSIIRVGKLIDRDFKLVRTQRPPRNFFPESFPLHPRTAYGAAKTAAASCPNRKRQLPITVLNYLYLSRIINKAHTLVESICSEVVYNRVGCNNGCHVKLGDQLFSWLPYALRF